MIRPRGIGSVPLSPELAHALLLIGAIVAVAVAIVLLAEFVLLRGAALYYRLTGHPPPRRSSMSAAISRLEEEARKR